MSWDDYLSTAAAQHGYFTTEQAAEHGISRRALTWRAQQGSPQRVGHGLYRLPHWPPDPSDELYALQALAGEPEIAWAQYRKPFTFELSDFEEQGSARGSVIG